MPVKYFDDWLLIADDFSRRKDSGVSVMAAHPTYVAIGLGVQQTPENRMCHSR